MLKNVFLQSLARKLLAGVERRKVLVFRSFAGLFIELIAKAIKINIKVGCIECVSLFLLSLIAPRGFLSAFPHSLFFEIAKTFISTFLLFSICANERVSVCMFEDDAILTRLGMENK